MYRPDDEFVKLRIVCHEPDTFSIRFRDEKAGELQSVGSSKGVIIPDLMYFSISKLAGS